jgi:hypothetical protein
MAKMMTASETLASSKNLHFCFGRTLPDAIDTERMVPIRSKQRQPVKELRAN